MLCEAQAPDEQLPDELSRLRDVAAQNRLPVGKPQIEIAADTPCIDGRGRRRLLGGERLAASLDRLHLANQPRQGVTREAHRLGEPRELDVERGQRGASRGRVHRRWR